MSSAAFPPAAMPGRFRAAMLPAVLTAVLFCLLGRHQLAAQPLEKTLLWEISGNGRARPSYLYGTMHLQDRRVFDLADSVLIALKRCAVFAPEADLDSIAPAMFRMMFSGDSSTDLRELLTPERYQALDSQLQATIGIPIDQVRHMKPWMIPFLRQQEAGGKDEATFLDAWLSRVARLEGLRLVGLESVQEHLSTFDALPLESADELFGSGDADDVERLISAYTSADLEAIARMMGESLSDTVARVLLTDRNHRMAERIESISRTEPVFAAVGAAHLIGPEGVIALLRSRGFTVRPVSAVRTGYARRYTPPERELPWRSVVDSAQGFALELPVEPIDIPLGMIEGMRMSMSPDFGTGIYYNLMKLDLPMLAGGDVEPMVDAMVKTMLAKKGSAVLSQQPLTITGGSGREVVMKLEMGKGVETRSYIRVIALGSRLYVLSASTTAAKRPKDVDRFFSSFRLLASADAPAPEGSAESEWKELVDPRGAFAVTMPTRVARRTLTVPTDDGFFDAMAIVAKEGKTGYVMLVGDLMRDDVLMNDETMFENSLDAGLRKFEGMEREVRMTTVQGFPAQDVTVWMPGGGSARMRVILRGNRIISMLANLSPGGDTIKARTFLESIRFLDPIDVPWKRARFDSLGFTAMFPGDPVVELLPIDEQASEDWVGGKVVYHNVYARDTASGLLYNIMSVGFHPFYAATGGDTSMFFDSMLGPILEDGDSVISMRRLSIGRASVEDLVIKRSAGHTLYRMRSIISGMRYYRAMLLAPESMLHAPQAERFFSSVLPLDTMESAQIFGTKLPLLLRDVREKWGPPQTVAIDRIRALRPNTVDLPVILEALREPFPDDTLADGIRGHLLWNYYVLSYESDPSGAVATIRQLLPAFERAPVVESRALRILMLLGTTEACSTVSARLLAGPRSARLLNEELIDQLASNLQCFGDRLPELFAYVDSAPLPTSLMNLAAVALRDSAVTIQYVQPFVPRFLTLAETALLATRATGWKTYALEAAELRQKEEVLTFLAAIPSSEHGRKLVALLRSDADPAIRRRAITPALLYGMDIPQDTIAALAADPRHRLSLCDELASIGRESLIPERYRTFQSLVDGYLRDSDRTVDSTEYVGERIRMIDGTEQHFYVFGVRREGIMNPVVVGPMSGRTISDIQNAGLVYGRDELDRDSIDAYVDGAIEEDEEE